MVQNLSSPKTSLILYGTETGTSQDLAHEVSGILERLHFETDVEEFDNVLPQSLAEYTLVVFVLSTTGQGEFPSNARKFWTSLLRKKLTSTFLAGVDYALVGLGDTSYPKFNWAARKLEKRIQQLGANSLLDPCEADEQGEDSTDGAFIAWTRLFKDKVLADFPLRGGELPIPDSQSLPSKWTTAEADINGTTNGQQESFQPQLSPQLSKLKPSIRMIVEDNARVTPENHWQDVRLMKFRTDQNVSYFPGDALAIQPENMAEDVQELITLMNWTSLADKPLRVKLNRKSSRSQHPLSASLSTDSGFTLRQLLTKKLDINAIPKRSFFAAIAHYTENEMHKERLLEFTDPQYLDEYYDYATRPRRSIIEILAEFDSVKIPWQEVINVFPILRPRQFSVASGGQLKQGGTTFELLVAIVKYRTVIKRIRQGVCTRYLAGLKSGTTLDVWLHPEGRFHTAQELSQKRHLLIGAGTGIAPLRSLIHEKQLLNPAGCSTTLIFGCRNAEADYFFRDEWKQLASESKPNSLQVVTAFSRDQKEKIYVQDRIRQNGDEVLQFLHDKNATIVICGSSGAMPKAIRQAFIDVLTTFAHPADSSPMIESEAEQFLAKIEKEGRYKQETW